MEGILFLATLGAVFVVAIWTIKAENAERKLAEAEAKRGTRRRIDSDPTGRDVESNGDLKRSARDHRKY